MRAKRESSLEAQTMTMQKQIASVQYLVSQLDQLSSRLNAVAEDVGNSLQTQRDRHDSRK